MTTDYTPTTYDVLQAYTGSTDTHEWAFYAAQFYRWLDQQYARAWDEGAKAAREEDFLADGFVESLNPYRQA